MTLLLWAAIGACLSALHLALLGAALQRAATKQPYQARLVVVRGLPLRLLAATPFLALATRGGLVPCLGLVGGSLLARWAICHWYSRRTVNG